MTLHLLFITISISKHKRTIEEIEQQKRTSRLVDQMKERQFLMYHSY